MYLTPQQKQRICSRLKIGDSDQCWEWQGMRFNSGYSAIKLFHKVRLVHRLIYQIFKGNPGKLFVLHKCDNRLCCNPYHLFLGTHQDNMDDMHNKNRGFVTKISDDVKQKIKDLYKQGINQKTIAKQVNLGEMSISRVLHGRLD